MYAVMVDALRELKHTPIIINGTTDHVHALWRHHPTDTVSNTLKIIKGRSSHFINDLGLTDDRFRWQGGYGAFSVSTSKVPIVKRYIQRQKIHHAQQTVQQEMRWFLEQHGAPEPEWYVFDEMA